MEIDIQKQAQVIAEIKVKASLDDLYESEKAALAEFEQTDYDIGVLAGIKKIISMIGSGEEVEMNEDMSEKPTTYIYGFTRGMQKASSLLKDNRG